MVKAGLTEMSGVAIVVTLSVLLRRILSKPRDDWMLPRTERDERRAMVRMLPLMLSQWYDLNRSNTHEHRSLSDERRKDVCRLL